MLLTTSEETTAISTAIIATLMNGRNDLQNLKNYLRNYFILLQADRNC